jgi:transcriptional repressor NrdR
MKCPNCDFHDSRVLDTRLQKGGDIRRRRECLKCKERFTTIESLLLQFPHVTKRDGVQEPFNKEKLKRGMQLACLKRPVSLAQIEDMVGRVCQSVTEQSDRQVSSVVLGQLVMKELKGIDDVAYVRFASVYKTFKDVQEFVQTLQGDRIERPPS